MDTIIIFTTWLLTILSFVIGYFIGLGRRPITVEEIKKEIRKKIVPSGPVMRPLAETVNRWSNKEQEEADEEFKRSFKLQHPEVKTPNL